MRCTFERIPSGKSDFIGDTHFSSPFGKNHAILSLNRSSQIFVPRTADKMAENSSGGKWKRLKNQIAFTKAARKQRIPAINQDKYRHSKLDFAGIV